jgi:hypothetical protein
VYQWLVFGHVLFAVIWVGGGIITQIYAGRAYKATDSGELVALVRQASWAGTTVFMPSSFLVLGFGIAAVLVGDLSFGELWITLGFVGFIATAITGSAFIAPRSKKLNATLAEQGPDSPEARRLAGQIINVGRIDVVVLVAVIAVMVLKPGT